MNVLVPRTMQIIELEISKRASLFHSKRIETSSRSRLPNQTSGRKNPRPADPASGTAPEAAISGHKFRRLLMSEARSIADQVRIVSSCSTGQ